MKNKIIIAAALGLLLGIAAKKLSEPAPSPTTPSVAQESSQRQEVADTQSLPELAWDIRGDLNSTEIQDLTIGARRNAELSLWSFSATAQDFADLWDDLVSRKITEHSSQSHLIALWVRNFPEEALAHIKGTKAEFTFWRALGRIDAAKGLALIDKSVRGNFLNLLAGIAEHDPDLALTLLKENPKTNTFSALVAVFEKLFKDDPAKALAFASKRNLNQWSHFRKWAASEPRKALVWAVENKNLSSPFFEKEMPSLVAELMKEDPEWATSAITALPTGAIKSQLLGAQAKHLSQSNPEEALALANSHQGRTRLKLLQEIASGAVDHDPSVAYDVLETFIEENTSIYGREKFTYSSGGSSGGGTSIWKQPWVFTLLDHDPDATMTLARKATENPNDPFAESIAPHLFSLWGNSDSAQAFTWLDQQAPDAHRDQLLSSYLNFAQFRDPVAISAHLERTQTLAQESERSRHSSKLIESWFRTEPQSAARYFESDRATPLQKELFQQLSAER